MSTCIEKKKWHGALFGKITKHLDEKYVGSSWEKVGRVSGQETWSMDRDEWKQLPGDKSGQKSRGQALRAFT